MATYTKQMQQIVDEYRLARQPWPASAKTMAEWAINTGRWQMPASAVLNKCASDLADAMREEYYTDPKGRRVRLLHPAATRRQGVMFTEWDDIRTATRQHMLVSFQQRRKAIVGDCRQMKVDLDSYNEFRSKEQPIQASFDFTMDLLEIEAGDEEAA
jgi:hypothetical protein